MIIALIFKFAKMYILSFLGDEGGEVVEFSMIVRGDCNFL
ncbi:Uncharacterised protein [Klebsiella quasipneumoniae]|nr:Uncharacterised protein [Klebsiella quasipneumoniae]